MRDIEAMMGHLKQSVQYIRNTGGNATLANFTEDHEPIGEMLWSDLIREGLAEIYLGKLRLTPKGDKFVSC